MTSDGDSLLIFWIALGFFTRPLNRFPQVIGNIRIWIATTYLKASFAMTIWKQFADYLDLLFARTCKTHFFANDEMAQQRKKGN